MESQKQPKLAHLIKKKLVLFWILLKFVVYEHLFYPMGKVPLKIMTYKDA